MIDLSLSDAGPTPGVSAENNRVSPPKVTVVVPAYNAGDHLHEALDSVVAQTFTDWELLVVDDCSTDDTPRIARGYAEADPRVRVLTQNANSGGRPAVPKNRALAEARGELVAFLDADDKWEPSKLERQVALMESRPDLVLSYVLFTRFGAGENPAKILPESASRFRGNAFRDLYSKPVIPNSGVMLRRNVIDALGPLTDDPRLTEDGDYFLRAARLGPIDYADGPPLLRYRANHASHSGAVVIAWRRMLAVSRAHSSHAGLPAYLRNVVVFTAHAAKRGWHSMRRPKS